MGWLVGSEAEGHHVSGSDGPFAGVWEDEDEQLVTIQDSRIRGPDGSVVDLVVSSGSTCSFTVGEHTIEGKLMDKGCRLAWSDNCIWTRRSTQQQVSRVVDFPSAEEQPSLGHVPPFEGQIQSLEDHDLQVDDVAAFRDEPLAAGDHVRLVGLKSQPDLNGQTGVLVKFKENRWLVGLDNGKGHKLVKAKHIERRSAGGQDQKSLQPVQEEEEGPGEEQGAQEADGSSPFDGTWEDEDGTVMSIKGSTLHGAGGGTFDFTTQSSTHCSFQADDVVFQGRLIGQGQRLKWSDGDVWIRKKSAEPLAEPEPAKQQQELPKARPQAVPAPDHEPHHPEQRREKVSLTAGDRVRLNGLKSQPDLNGRTGTLVAWVENRWQVTLDDRRGSKLIKAKYVELLSKGPTPASQPGEPPAPDAKAAPPTPFLAPAAAKPEAAEPPPPEAPAQEGEEEEEEHERVEEEPAPREEADEELQHAAAAGPPGPAELVPWELPEPSPAQRSAAEGLEEAAAAPATAQEQAAAAAQDAAPTGPPAPKPPPAAAHEEQAAAAAQDAAPTAQDAAPMGPPAPKPLPAAAHEEPSLAQEPTPSSASSSQPAPARAPEQGAPAGSTVPSSAAAPEPAVVEEPAASPRRPLQEGRLEAVAPDQLRSVGAAQRAPRQRGAFSAAAGEHGDQHFAEAGAAASVASAGAVAEAARAEPSTPSSSSTALVPRRQRGPPAILPQDTPRTLSAGERVRVRGLVHPQNLNGLNGTFIAMQERPRGRANPEAKVIVRLDGFLDNTSMRIENVHSLCDPVPVPDFNALHVVGTWDSWKAHSMSWSSKHSCYFFDMEMGKTGQEKFQIWVDGDSDLCVYPDQTSASPYFDHRLCGPDGGGDGKNWLVGKHPLDRSTLGARYRIRAFLSEDRRYMEVVDWVRLLVDDFDNEDSLMRRKSPQLLPKMPAPVRLPLHRSVAIVGSWDDYSSRQLMQWNASIKGYCFTVEVGAEGWAEFQILLDGDFSLRLYPDKDKEQHRICGPDSRGDGMNWCLWPGKAAWFEIRLHLDDDGSATRVSWARLPHKPPKLLSSVNATVQLGEYSSVCIVGRWNDWTTKDQMRWDAERHCFCFVVQAEKGCQEEFQILLDGDWSRCLHPNRSCANPNSEYKLCGPDEAGHGLNWMIGPLAEYKNRARLQCEVRLQLSEDGSLAKGVDWSRIHE